MSENCLNTMAENEEKKTEKEERKDRESDPHFVKGSSSLFFNPHSYNLIVIEISITI